MLELVGQDLLGVEQQAPDERRLAVVDGAGGGEAQQVGGAASAMLEVPRDLAVFHRGLGDAVVGARLAALGDPRRGDLGDDRAEVGGGRRTAPVQLMSPTVR